MTGRAGLTRVLIFGPPVTGNARGYGGGQGGYVNYIRALFRYFQGTSVHIAHCEYSVRAFTRFWYLRLPFRFLNDVRTLYRMLPQAATVHILGSSGPAVVRNLAAVLIAKRMQKRVVFDIRGGGPRTYPNSAMPFLPRWMLSVVIRNSDVVLVQGREVAGKLRAAFGTEIHHQPNMVLEQDLPREIPRRLNGVVVRALFVGYCYRDKGVFDLVEGSLLAVKEGMQLSLTLIGKEDPEFTAYLDGLSLPAGLEIDRCGVRRRSEVMRMMSDSDVFVFPTYHRGEGHPNVINEAMANALPIITSKQGYIGEVLTEESAYFVRARRPEDVCRCLRRVDSHREEARRKGLEARRKLEVEFTDSVVLGRLKKIYEGAEAP